MQMPSRETSCFKRVSSLVMSSKRIRYLDELPKSSQWQNILDVSKMDMLDRCVCLMVSCHMCIHIYIYMYIIRLCLMNENDVYIMYKSMFMYIYIYIL